MSTEKKFEVRVKYLEILRPLFLSLFTENTPRELRYLTLDRIIDKTGCSQRFAQRLLNDAIDDEIVEAVRRNDPRVSGRIKAHDWAINICLPNPKMDYNRVKAWFTTLQSDAMLHKIRRRMGRINGAISVTARNKGFKPTHSRKLRKKTADGTVLAVVTGEKKAIQPSLHLGAPVPKHKIELQKQMQLKLSQEDLNSLLVDSDWNVCTCCGSSDMELHFAKASCSTDGRIDIPMQCCVCGKSIMVRSLVITRKTVVEQTLVSLK